MQIECNWFKYSLVQITKVLLWLNVDNLPITPLLYNFKLPILLVYRNLAQLQTPPDRNYVVITDSFRSD